MRLRTTPLRALLAPLALVACGGEEAVERERAPRPVAWDAATPHAEATVRRLPGVVRPIERAPLSFEAGGRVRKVRVDIGDHFGAGEVLAELDPRTYRLTLEERRAELGEMRAALAEAEADFERQTRLFGEGWIAQAAYDSAESRFETARNRLETALSRVAMAEEALEDTVLEAPFAGVVAGRLVEPAQQVAAGERVFDVQGNSGGVEVRIAAPETIVDRLEVGTEHAVELPVRPGLDLVGRVTQIGAEAAEANAYPVTLRLIDAPADLRTGLTAEVDLRLGVAAERDLLAVPVAAAQASEDGAYHVFVVEDGVALRRPVELADLAGDRALVAAGLAAGETVVTRGAAFLSDGQPVELLGAGVSRFEEIAENSD